jgi:hypothetical protein
MWSNSADWYKYQDEATSWWEKTMIKRHHSVGLTTVAPLDCSELVPANSSALSYMCDEGRGDCNFECMPGSCRVEALKKLNKPFLPWVSLAKS